MGAFLVETAGGEHLDFTRKFMKKIVLLLLDAWNSRGRSGVRCEKIKLW